MSLEIITKPLLPDEEVLLPFDRHIAHQDVTRIVFGISGVVLGDVRVGTDVLNIIHAPEEPRLPSGLIVANDGYYLGDPVGYQQIAPGVTMQFGRGRGRDGNIAYGEGYSREHFMLTNDKPNAQAIFRNQHPTNTTHLRLLADVIQSNPPAPDNGSVYREYTAYADDWVRQQGRRYREPDHASEYGYYDGYRILGRNSDRIENGVWIMNEGDEVTLLKADKRVMRAYQPLRTQLAKIGNVATRDMALMATKHVESLLEYDLARTDALTERYWRKGKILPISETIRRGYGVCRHMGPLAALFAELAQRDGFAAEPYHAFLERNEDKRAGGGHGWGGIEPLPSTGNGDEDYILDPAQDFFRTRAEARHDGSLRWRY